MRVGMEGAEREGLRVSYTDNPRSVRDTEGGREASVAMWHGVVAAVNLHVGRQAAAFIGLKDSAWTQMSLRLLPDRVSEPNFGLQEDSFSFRWASLLVRMARSF